MFIPNMWTPTKLAFGGMILFFYKEASVSPSRVTKYSTIRFGHMQMLCIQLGSFFNWFAPLCQF